MQMEFNFQALVNITKARCNNLRNMIADPAISTVLVTVQDVTDCSKCPDSTAVHQKSTSKAGRPHTVTQTAGFIHRLDKLCGQSHQLQPGSYPFTGCLHWWPDYSEQVTVKSKGLDCWRSALTKADAKTKEKDQAQWFTGSHFWRHIMVKTGGASNCKETWINVKVMMPKQILSLRLQP